MFKSQESGDSCFPESSSPAALGSLWIQEIKVGRGGGAACGEIPIKQLWMSWNCCFPSLELSGMCPKEPHEAEYKCGDKT